MAALTLENLAFEIEALRVELEVTRDMARHLARLAPDDAKRAALAAMPDLIRSVSPALFLPPLARHQVQVRLAQAVQRMRADFMPE